MPPVSFRLLAISFGLACSTPALAQSTPASNLTHAEHRASSEAEDDAAMQRLETIQRETLKSLENALPLSLENALAIALSEAPTIAIREAETRIAHARAESTKSSYRPTINLTAGIELNTGSGYVAGSSQLSDTQRRTTATSLNASLSASQLIYDFGSHAARRRGAKASVRSAIALEEQHLQDLRTTVIEQYLRAGAAREKLAVAYHAQRTEMRRAEQIDAFVDVGQRPRIDRATARANLANATAQIIRAATDYDLATYDLLAAMGIDETRALHIQWTNLETEELEHLDVQELRSQGIAQRGEFASLVNDLQTAEANLKENFAQNLPTLHAVAGVNESLLIGDSGRWNAYIGARLNWDLYRGSQTQFQKRELEAQRDRLAIEEQTLLIELVQSIRRAQRQILGAKALQDTRQIARTHAAKQLELAQARYDTGLGNIVELSDAQLAYTQAQFEQIDAALELALARADLISAVAGWQ